MALSLRPDGKIGVAGYSSLNGDSDFAVFEVNTNLNFDASFQPATNGNIAIVNGFTKATGPGSVNSVVTLPDGRILVVGYIDTYPIDFCALARYLPDGNLDPTFAGGGLFTVSGETNSTGVDAVVQPDGKTILLAGRLL